VIGTDDILPEDPRKDRGTLGRSLADIVDDAERQAIQAALRGNDGSRDRAAQQLDISPTTLWRKMTRLGISER
jgi:two-component system response regulator HydG